MSWIRCSKLNYIATKLSHTHLLGAKVLQEGCFSDEAPRKTPSLVTSASTLLHGNAKPPVAVHGSLKEKAVRRVS